MFNIGCISVHQYEYQYMNRLHKRDVQVYALVSGDEVYDIVFDTETLFFSLLAFCEMQQHSIIYLNILDALCAFGSGYWYCDIHKYNIVFHYVYTS